MNSLAGRCAVITGGGRGIGAAIAKLLASEGAKVVVNDLGVDLDGTGPNSDLASQIASDIVREGGVAVANSGDVASFEDARALIGVALTNFGGLDIIINTAGILRDRMIFNMTEEDWDSVIAVHLKGTFNTCRHGASYWRSRHDPAGHFRIINFTSGSGLFGSPGQSNYAAAKMGIVGLTYSCANALRRYGVTVNAIAPGALTRMGASVPQDRQVAPGVKEEPLPAHVATVVGYIAATRSDWLTGRIIGSLGHAITLYSDPTTQSELVSDEPWTVESAGRALERVFMPIVSHTNPLFEDQIRRAEGGGVR